jgi:hypothetical protein
LDYERIALARPHGVFHAKNILLMVENIDEDNAEPDRTWNSLVLVTTSANLTRCGWHENLEVAHVLEINPGDTSAVRSDLLNMRGLLSVLEDASPGANLYGTPPHPAIESIRRFLREEAESPSYLKQGGRLRTRLYVGREPVAKFLSETGRINPGEYSLEIVSPFFENTSDARTLKVLLSELQPIETRVFLPFDDDGKARCSGEYFEAVRDLENVYWARLPDDLTRWSGKVSTGKRRNVHAKIYRLFKRARSSSDWREVQLVGSVNLTGAAHAGGTERNFETAALVDLPCEHEPDWWMRRLSSLPLEFATREPEDEAGKLACHEVVLRFDWQTSELDCFWKAEPRLPSRATISGCGCPLFEIANVVVDRWWALDAAASQRMREHLNSSSLVELQIAGESPQPLLVQEVNMGNKPPLLEKLTPAEILEYWSLLTPDRRNDFLERKITAFIARVEVGQRIVAPPDAPEAFFDHFAGIFHAFSCFEEHTLEALKRGAEKEVRYRLLSTSPDSLPNLVDQVKITAEKDPAAAYVTLLCASQVFSRLRKAVRQQGIKSSFLDVPAIKGLCSDYDTKWQQATQTIRARIDLGEELDANRFFAWYEDAFAKPVRVVANPNGGEDNG